MTMPDFILSELDLLYALVMDRQKRAEESGMSQTDPTSMFRYRLLDKLGKAKSAAQREAAAEEERQTILQDREERGLPFVLRGKNA